MYLVSLGFVDIIKTVLDGVFSAALQPVLTATFMLILNTLVDLIVDFFAIILIKIWVVLLKLIYFLDSLFNLFTGLTEVKDTSLDVSETGLTLVDYLFQHDTISSIVLVITLIAFALTFLTTILATIRSMGDLSADNKHPLSSVFRDAGKAALSVLLIPFMCLTMLTMTTTVMLVIEQEMMTVDNADISDLLFITIAGGAIRDENKLEKYSADHAYEDFASVLDDFDTAQINYILAYVSSAFVGMILFTTILQSILRIFALMLLYVVSPLAAVFIPLDGGEKFNTWKRMFVAYAVSAFGPLLALKVYFILVQVVFASGSTIDFGVSALLTCVIEIILLLGGMYSVYQSRNLFVELIDPGAASLLGGAGFIVSAGLDKINDFMTGANDG